MTHNRLPHNLEAPASSAELESLSLLIANRIISNDDCVCETISDPETGKIYDKFYLAVSHEQIREAFKITALGVKKDAQLWCKIPRDGVEAAAAGLSYTTLQFADERITSSHVEYSIEKPVDYTGAKTVTFDSNKPPQEVHVEVDESSNRTHTMRDVKVASGTAPINTKDGTSIRELLDQLEKN